MKRTQIYLDEDQQRALRALAADRSVTVSDIVRDAIDRLLNHEFADASLGERFDALRARIQERLGNISDSDIESAFRKARTKKRQVSHA